MKWAGRLAAQSSRPNGSCPRTEETRASRLGRQPTPAAALHSRASRRVFGSSSRPDITTGRPRSRSNSTPALANRCRSHFCPGRSSLLRAACLVRVACRWRGPS